MFSFVGDNRSRPNVSLGGASKQEKTESLLVKNQLERQKRENHRRRIVSATQLQSWWRGSRVRQSRRQNEREEFDAALQRYYKSRGYLTRNALSTLHRQILYFYKERKDSVRLVSLCQLLIKHPNVSLEFFLDQPQLWVYQTGHVLLHCSQLLETAAQSSTPISWPLRVIEIYTSIDTYTKDNKLSQIQATQLVIKLMTSLIHKGYYQSVRTLLNERVPSDIEQPLNPPTRIASIVLELVLRPIKLSQSCRENKQFRNVVFEGLCQNLFCPSLTNQIVLFLLPELAYGKYPFPFVDFLHCLIPQDTMETNQPTDTGLDHLTVSASPWLLYSVLLLVEPVADDLNAEEKIIYLQVLKVLMPSLSDSESEMQKRVGERQMSCVINLSNVRDECWQLMISVPFEVKVKILQGFLIKDKEKSQGGEMQNFLNGPVINITIRRNYIYEDAFDKLRPDNEPDFKKKMRVQLINAAGLSEAGIDGGGLFREFLSELLKTGFDPNRGFFTTTDDRLLYPNPQASLLEQDYTKHYFFMGRMLGKVIYENMLIELPFASFFLSKILGRHSADVDIHHLQSLDPELYKNLLFLKNYDGDVSDLGLDFTVMDNDLGEAKVHELKPGGRDITVTINNRIEYIHLIADHRLNKQIRPHCIAFREGLSNVINLDWLRMFDYHEIQTLISGAAIPVDLDDLRQHTNYSGGYTSEHDVIQAFWSVVENFNDRQRRQLLKFVTSCSRPPLLGFKDLYPAFCIHYGGSDADRLPSASTCMNLLKLPAFTEKQVLSNKLLYAIESGAGFELS